MSFLTLPPETITTIARFTGWNTQLRLTCKQVSRCFAGPAYNYDTCIPRLGAQLWKFSLPDSQKNIVRKDFPPAAQLFVADTNDNDDADAEADGGRTWVTLTPQNTGWTDYIKELFYSLSDLDYEGRAVTAMRLDFGAGNLGSIESVHLFMGSFMTHLFSFTEGLNTSRWTDHSIPIFPLQMPLLLGYMKKVSICLSVSLKKKHANDTALPYIDVSIQLAKLKMPWESGLSVTYLNLTPEFIRLAHVFGWAFHFPVGRKPCVLQVFFKGAKDDEVFYLDTKELGNRHDEFPCALDPSRFIVIPPLDFPRWSFHRFMPFWHEWSVGYTWMDHDTNQVREELFDEDSVYRLHPIGLTFLNGGNKVTRWACNATTYL